MPFAIAADKGRVRRVAFLCVLALACSSPTSERPGNNFVPGKDDPGTKLDAGSGGPDAAEDEPDAAEGAPDAAEGLPDAGENQADAGENEADAGPPNDSGVPAPVEFAAYPSPVTVNLRDLWGTAQDHVLAVGDDGTVLRFDGTDWQVVPDVPTTEDLYGVWGTSPSDVYVAGGGGTILHYDGTDWTDVGPGGSTNFRSLYGSGSMVVAVGSAAVANVAWQSTGGQFTVAMTGASGSLYGTWVTTGPEAFLTGNGGEILHYDGAAWSAMTSNTTEWLTEVAGRAPNDVWASGRGGTVLHYDGASWQPEQVPTMAHVRGLWVAPAEVYAVGYDTSDPSAEGGFMLRRRGGTWSAVGIPTTPNLWAVWGTAADDVWAVGFDGAILHGP